ncbi:MAG TPA: 3-hydroxyacyl-CoA dehydrogenase family protein, partial [Chryseolinea sp.]|nr:3-hydroxyacyl-CoA dehydrogenase family protein [Chryseolinea sp.]
EVENLEECKTRFGDSHTYMFETDHREAERFIETNDLVFDFIIDEEPFQIDIYKNKSNGIVFFNAAKISLAELSNLAEHSIKADVYGFNGLPTFVSQEILEVSLLKPEHEDQLKEICAKLDIHYLIVDDRVGLVTPRVVCMIINEAYYTVQDGTASREDIDKAMKLGTNYPYGPFEWCSLIGIKHVYELLEALYEDTHDERYKICSLLKKEYLLQS